MMTSRNDSDKRILGPDGEPLPSTSDDSSKAAENQQSQAKVTVSFASFVLSLSTSAMVHLGTMPHPETQKTDENLEIAEQEIQIIEMLRTKTEGNRSDEEDRLIQDVLFHLRMKYLDKSKK